MKDFKDEMKDFKDEMNKRWGDLANKMGTLVEDLIIPNLPELMKKTFDLGEPDDVMVRRKKRIKKNDIRQEFDAILVYEEKKLIVWNETKSNATKDSIKKFAKKNRRQIILSILP